ncbi:MAG: ATPase, T2SS/T4P/T4SS family [Syntrophaceae bacterium]
MDLTELDEIDEIAELREFQRMQEGLLNISYLIESAKNIKEILVDTRESILELFKVEFVNIYVVDRSHKDIYSLVPDGNTFNEFRLPIDKNSIPGYVATTSNVVNIADVYNTEELKSIDNELTFDTATDEKSDFQTKQVLAVPILYNNELMGVIQLVNKTDTLAEFAEEEPVMLHEVAEVLGAAFHNHQKIKGKRKKTKFGYLISHELINEEELNSARKEAIANKESLEAVLMKKYKISKDDILKSLEEFYQCRFITFNNKVTIPVNLLMNLEREQLLRNLWTPLEKIDGYIHVIVDDPRNVQKCDAIESILNTKAIKYDVASPEDITKFINHFFPSDIAEPSVPDVLEINDISGATIYKEEDEEDNDEEDAITESEDEAMQIVSKREIAGDLDDLAAKGEIIKEISGVGIAKHVADISETIKESDGVIIQLVNKIINEAFLRGASDIHIEPDVESESVGVRYRIDGSCVTHLTVPYSYRAALVSRIKIMSNLDITVRRVPQDGKIRINKPGGGKIELRVATMPTQGSVEDIVMRILNVGNALPLEAMGMTKRNYRELLKVCEKPYGLILVVGPTGSGKTTTLHAALRHINTPDRKIWTAEDPVEITQRGLRQVQVQPKIGFDFAAAMRSFLRSDPDVIMVGEMRDYETSKIAVEASLTGHLVFSTLHTNSAPETITRLLDIGIDAFNFSDSLLGILAQRLVKTLCKKCREAYHPTASEYNEMSNSYGEELFEKLNIPNINDLILYRPKGCDSCNNSGYKGRMAIHELLINSEALKSTILKRDSIEILRDIAITEGMRTLLQDGILKAIIGITDLRQVFRACIK